MKERTPKDSSTNLHSKLVAERRPSPEVTYGASASVSHGAGDWKKYCDDRLRHFATGR